MSDILLSTFSYLFFMTIHWTYSRGHQCTYQFGIRCYPDWGLVPFSPNSNSIFKFSLAPIILHSPFSFILWLARLFSGHKKNPAGMLLWKDTLGPLTSPTCQNSRSQDMMMIYEHLDGGSLATDSDTINFSIWKRFSRTLSIV